MKALDYTALILSIVGALNWGLIGLFRFDLVAFLFGNMSPALKNHLRSCSSMRSIIFLPSSEGSGMERNTDT